MSQQIFVITGYLMNEPERLYTVIKELFFTLDSGDDYLFRQYGMSVTRYYALYHLEQHPGISLTELSRLMLCDKSNVTRIAKSLERDGLAKRLSHETDKRSARLYLSEKGHRLREKIESAHRAFNRQRFELASAELDEESIYQALQLLKDRLATDLMRLSQLQSSN